MRSSSKVSSSPKDLPPSYENHEDWWDFAVKTVSFCTFLSLGVIGYDLFTLNDQISSLDRLTGGEGSFHDPNLQAATPTDLAPSAMAMGPEMKSYPLQEVKHPIANIDPRLLSDCLYPQTHLDSPPKICLQKMFSTYRLDSWTIQFAIRNLEKSGGNTIKGRLVAWTVNNREESAKIINEKPEILQKILDESGVTFVARNYTVKTIKLKKIHQISDKTAQALILIQNQVTHTLSWTLTEPLGEYPHFESTAEQTNEPAS